MNFIFAGILGLLVGILVNYLADVLPTRRKLVRPACANCNADYSWKDYFLLKGCSVCHTPHGWRAPLSLLAGVVSALLLWLYPPANFGFWLGLLVAGFFGLVIIIDVEHRLILHMVSLAGAFLGFAVGTLRFGWKGTLIGGAIGLGLMLLFYWFGILFARARAKKLGKDDDEEALGFGDVTISGVLGLMLGPFVLHGLVTGILLAGVFSILLIAWLVIRKKFETSAIYIAYGPFLVLGAAYYVFIYPFFQ